MVGASSDRFAGHIEHGGQCDCEALAKALRLRHEAISFDYCLRVLQKHWRMTCRHGSPDSSSGPCIADRWREVGPMDAVKAILIDQRPVD